MLRTFAMGTRSMFRAKMPTYFRRDVYCKDVMTYEFARESYKKYAINRMDTTDEICVCEWREFWESIIAMLCVMYNTGANQTNQDNTTI